MLTARSPVWAQSVGGGGKRDRGRGEMGELVGGEGQAGIIPKALSGGR